MYAFDMVSGYWVPNGMRWA